MEILDLLLSERQKSVADLYAAHREEQEFQRQEDEEYDLFCKRLDSGWYQGRDL